MKKILFLILLPSIAFAYDQNGAAFDYGGSSAMSGGGEASMDWNLGVYDLLSTPATGAQCIYDELGSTCGTRTDDANSNNRYFTGSNVYPFAAVAKTAGNTYITGGIDSRTFNVLDGLGACTGADTAIATVINNGTSYVTTCTYGTDWGTGGGLTATIAATQLAACLEAGTGIGSAASGATCPGGAAGDRCVGVTADRFTVSIVLTQNDASCTVMAQTGTSGVNIAGTEDLFFRRYSATNLCLTDAAGNYGPCFYENGTPGLSGGPTGALKLQMYASPFEQNGNSDLKGVVTIGTTSTIILTAAAASKGQTATLTPAVGTCTFASGATCTTAAFIPYGAALWTISGRQVTAGGDDTLATCSAGLNLGAGLDADQLGAALECDVDNTLYTMATATASIVATCLLAGGCTLTMTADAGHGGTLSAVWTAWYITSTAATSD